MKLVSMEMTKKEMKANDGPQIVGSSGNGESGPRYPYGLEISLEKPSIEKLGLDVKQISAGDEVSVVCKCTVTMLSISKRGDGSQEQTISLQITDMGLNTDDLDWDTGYSKASKILSERG